MKSIHLIHIALLPFDFEIHIIFIQSFSYQTKYF